MLLFTGYRWGRATAHKKLGELLCSLDVIRTHRSGTLKPGGVLFESGSLAQTGVDAVKWAKDREGHKHLELSAEEARQGRLGTPVLYALIAVTLRSAIGIGIVGVVTG